LSLHVDRDQGDAGGIMRINPDETGINPLATHSLEHLLSKGIAAHPANHGDARAQSRRGYRLVRTLAAWKCSEAPAEQRLTGPRDSGHLDDQVHVQTANNEMWD
jgi:hypothetical protein